MNPNSFARGFIFFLLGSIAVFGWLPSTWASPPKKSAPLDSTSFEVEGCHDGPLYLSPSMNGIVGDRWLELMGHKQDPDVPRFTHADPETGASDIRELVFNIQTRKIQSWNMPWTRLRSVFLPLMLDGKGSLRVSNGQMVSQESMSLIWVSPDGKRVGYMISSMDDLLSRKKRHQSFLAFWTIGSEEPLTLTPLIVQSESKEDQGWIQVLHRSVPGQILVLVNKVIPPQKLGNERLRVSLLAIDPMTGKLDQLLDFEPEERVKSAEPYLLGRYSRFSRDGRYLALAEYTDVRAQKPRLFVVDLLEKKVKNYPGVVHPYGLDWSPDGKRLILGSSSEKRLELREFDRDTPIRTANVPNLMHHATYSEDGKRIWVLARKNNVMAYDSETLKPLPSLDLAKVFGESVRNRAINASFPQPSNTAGLALGMNSTSNEYDDSIKVCWLKLK